MRVHKDGIPNFSKKTAVGFSLLLHALLAFVLFWSLHLKENPGEKSIDINIIDLTPISPKHPPPLIPTHLNQKGPKTSVPKTGVSRDSTITQSTTATSVGNTLSKAPDNLPSTDATLPKPAEEYEIQTWPQLQNDVRIPYPAKAKQKGIEGTVIMDLYVSESGNVRRVTLVKGLSDGLTEAALSAAQKFIFSPATVENKNVSVIIRYSYKFVIQK